MSIDFTSFKLYDTDILDLLWCGVPEQLLSPRSAPEDHEGVFDDLQEKDLICSIFLRSYPRAYSLLRKLEHPLSPTDAMAACLCALGSTKKLMHTLLDHCPPIPEFQFRGVGRVSSLLNVAAEFDLADDLALLLARGADPTGGPAPRAARPPVEEAFCRGSYSCLKRLLEIPDLEVALTEEMLDTWGALEKNAFDSDCSNPLQLWCCQLLLEKLTGGPSPLFDPLPVPPQLRLGHALQHSNFELATKICTARPLTGSDAADVLAHYTHNRQAPRLLAESDAILCAKQTQENRFLSQLLHRRPDLLHTPQLRSALAMAALALPEEDPVLIPWTKQLEDGPISLSALPRRGVEHLTLHQSFPLWGPAEGIEETFFTRWDTRLGSRLIPTMDINAPSLQNLSPGSVQQLLRRVDFVGTPPADSLSTMAAQVILYAPEEMFPQLLQPDGLLAQEQAHLLLDACLELPAGRRNRILPYVRKAANYQL